MSIQVSFFRSLCAATSANNRTFLTSSWFGIQLFFSVSSWHIIKFGIIYRHLMCVYGRPRTRKVKVQRLEPRHINKFPPIPRRSHRNQDRCMFSDGNICDTGCYGLCLYTGIDLHLRQGFSFRWKSVHISKQVWFVGFFFLAWMIPSLLYGRVEGANNLQRSLSFLLDFMALGPLSGCKATGGCFRKTDV